MYILKELFLHIGYGKTGSSALQTWLALNKNLLHEQRFHYAGLNIEAKSYGVSAGNAGNLIKYLYEDSVTESALIDYYFDKYDRAIISAEGLQTISAVEAAKLNDFAVRHDLSIRVVAYIRNIYNHNYSNYVQAVKRKGWLLTFDEWAAEKLNVYPIEFYLELRKFMSIMLIDYEAEVTDIASAFCDRVGLDYSKLFKIKNRKVNRTLTHSEIFFLQRYLFAANDTNIDPAAFARLISDYLVNNFPEIESKVFYSEEIHRSIENKFGLLIQNFNKLSSENYGFELKVLNDSGYLTSNKEDSASIEGARKRVVAAITAQADVIGWRNLFSIARGSIRTNFFGAIRIVLSGFYLVLRGKWFDDYVSP